jgi:hypothetical protein
LWPAAARAVSSSSVGLRIGSILSAMMSLACAGHAGSGANGIDSSIADETRAQAVDAAPFDSVADAPPELSMDGKADVDPCVRVCPSAEPAEGDACDDGPPCEYGDDPQIECNRVYACLSGRFSRFQPAFVSVCPSVLAPGCPPTRGSVAVGRACDTVDLRCPYADGECDCVSQGSDGGAFWLCFFPHNSSVLNDASCPLPRPNLGAACSLPPNAICQYEPICVYQACSPCGKWVNGGVARGLIHLPDAGH